MGWKRCCHRTENIPERDVWTQSGRSCGGFTKKFAIIALIVLGAIILLSVSISVPLTVTSTAQAGKRQSSGNEGAMPEWSEWEACSKPCGNGTRTRQLNCSTATGPCDSSVFETQDCNTRVCNTFLCSGQTYDICTNHMKLWQVDELNSTHITLKGNCTPADLADVEEFLLIVTQSDLVDYGKYETVTIKHPVTESCVVPLASPLSKLSNLTSNPCEIMAQRIPSFDYFILANSCNLTCRARYALTKDSYGYLEIKLGGVLAVRASNLRIDNTSLMEVNGKGYIGGIGGEDSHTYLRPGFGGETFTCFPEFEGKGGEYTNYGIGSGGSARGKVSGPGGYHAGGSAGDYDHADEGTGGGGGGGHFSGGGGGGASRGGCPGKPGGKGGLAIQEIGRFAGGGGNEGCFSDYGEGRNNTLIPGNLGRDGTSERGGRGGSSTYPSYEWGGTPGGGGGMQYGSLDFNNRISFGGGGGGSGGSAYNWGGDGGYGGNGGGIILLFLKQLTLEGKIQANGVQGECGPNPNNVRTGAGGSGAGGSVVIYTDVLIGDPSTKITVNGAPPNNNCKFGRGGGGGGVGRWVIKTKDSVLTSGG